MVTVCLNMIVKNEAHIIAETLNKLISKIKFDYYVICDTGSDDNTPEIINNFFNEHSIPGEIFINEWRDFGYNRSLALKYAKNKADYILIFDADDTIIGDIIIPEKLTFDSYYLKFENYQRVCLVKGDLNWKYIGVLHEYISCETEVTESVIEGNYFIVSGRTSSRNKDPKKYLKDAEILKKGYYDSLNDGDGLHNRYVYYCANSYCDAGLKEEAIQWYLKTLESEGWYEERYNACIKLGDLIETNERYYYYLESYRHSQKRVEGILKLIIHYTCKSNYDIAWSYYTLIQNYYENEYPTDRLSTKLFANIADYTFYLPYYMIIVCEKLGKNETGLKMYTLICDKKPESSQWWINNLVYNFQFFKNSEKVIPKLKSYLDYLKTKGIVEAPEWKNTLRLFNNSFKIFIYTGFAEKPWNDTWALTNALGGSERAILNLVKCFPSNYNITIAGDLIPEQIDNVTFITRNDINNVLNVHFDVIIVSRYVSFFTLYPRFKCDKLILMAHDTYFMNNLIGCNKSSNEIIKENLNKIYTTVCLTKWHRNHFQQVTHPELKEIRIINNGINPELFKTKFTKIANSFVYTSGSMRGLYRLMQLWEDILVLFPNANLNISSYEDFPKNDTDILIKEMIDHYPSVIHHGKLNQNDLYHLMGKSEYWLYPCCFDETSCITALEMLMSEVICLYYPRAGLVDTIGKYGIQISEGNEIQSLKNIDKNYYRVNGRRYAESISWQNQSKLWVNLFQESRKAFYAKEIFAGEMIRDYINSLENVIYTNNYSDLLPTDEVVFVYEIFDDRVFYNFKKVAYLNTEPLNIDRRINFVVNDIVGKYPGIKIYDYSLANIKFMELKGITNLHHLGYQLNPEENKFLISQKQKNKQIYDFGIICSSGKWTNKVDDLEPPRRQSVVKYLLSQGFKVNIIQGYSKERDIELSKCKTILNIHGQCGQEPSSVFEHIRCDRLLHAGYQILSEESDYFENTWENLEMIPYSSFFNLKKRKIVDCFTFYNEIELLNYRLKVLENVVDYFVIVEANQTHAGKKKDLNFKCFNEKIIYLAVDLPHVGNITPDQVWENEKYQRNCIEQGLLQLNLNGNDLIIVSDLDEIPDPRTLKGIEINDIAQFEQDFYYYSLEHKMDHLWYFSKIMKYSFYINTNLTFSDIRSMAFTTIPNGGWHLSYFGSAEFIQNKITNFAHQEYNTPEFTNIDKIKQRLDQGVDIYDRPIKITKMSIHKNKNIPIGYFPETVVFIHSCNLDNCKKLDHLMECLIPYNFKIKICNIGPVIKKDYPAEIYEVSENVELYEIPTINKLLSYSKTSTSNIIYIHTKGVTSDSQPVRDWVDMMLYFILQNDLGIFDVAGCNFKYLPKPHFSGNFWIAKSSYLQRLPPLNQEQSFMEAEFWVLSGNPKFKVLHNSNIDQFQFCYPKINYINLVSHVKNAIERSYNNISKLSQEILFIEGKSGNKTRHLYNNICNIPGAKYLEIGTWKGSSFISAMYSNDISGICIDNWSEFDGPRETFELNIKNFLPNSNVTILNQDCWTVMDLSGINVMMYDGAHTYQDQKMAVTHFAKYCTRPFILMVDDWMCDWVDVKRGTMDGIKETGLEIVYSHEIGLVNTTDFHQGGDTFWNGCGIFVLK